MLNALKFLEGMDECSFIEDIDILFADAQDLVLESRQEEDPEEIEETTGRLLQL